MATEQYYISQAHEAWISFPPPPFSLLPPLFSKFSYKSFLFQNFEKRGGVVEKRGDEETKSMPHAPVLHMVRNGYGAKYIWYEMVNYGTKWLWCNIHMVRNCNFVVRNGKLWYEMVMMQNSLVPATPRIFLFDIGVR